jgi:glucose-1-phosphate thymidylyltransferase
MKGVILAGGEGTRLRPCTKVTNKHLLPVYNKPMIYYAIENMISAGIDDILILPGKNHAGDFAKLLGSGQEFNVKFTFIVQDHAGGLAYAVGLAEGFVQNDNFMVILGDNIIEHNFSDEVKNFKSGAQIFCKEVSDPQRFGVALIQDDQVLSIEEKPKEPKSNWAVIGAYIYDKNTFDYIRTIKPSDRGELEITDLNNIYIAKNQMTASFIQGEWYDTGTHESLVEASSHLMKKNKPLTEIKINKANSPKVGIGLVLYKHRKYLPFLLDSVKKQDYKNLAIYLVDNNDDKDNEDIKFIKTNYPEINILETKTNTGFSAGNNLLINQAKKDGCEFYSAINPDMILEDNYISELLNSLAKSPKIATVIGKIKKWNFEAVDNNNSGKTNYLDSTGLEITKEHSFFDRGQGEIDHGQYDTEEEIFGATGAGVMYRISSLEDIAFIDETNNKQYFDELMFAYKEDVDLAYRLQLAGYKSIYNPLAVAYHDRTIFSAGKGLISIVKNRINKNKSDINKEWSFLNHHIILQKNLDNNFSFNTISKTLWYELKSFVYILFFEPFLLKQYFKLFSLRKEIQARKVQAKKRISINNQIEKWMR